MDLPCANNSIQSTYYTTSVSLEESCQIVPPLMSDAAEGVVLLRLNNMLAGTKVDSDAIRWCVQMIGRVPHNDKIVTAVLRVIEKSPEAVPRGENSFCCPVCNLLSVHLKKPGFQAKSMSVIDTALVREEGTKKLELTKSLVSECNILQSVIATLEHHMDNAAVVLKAVTLLRTIVLVDEEYPSMLIDIGGSSTFIKLFNRYRTSVSVVPEALLVIEAIAEIPSLAATLFEEGHMGILLSVHLAQPMQPTLALEMICSAMATNYDYLQYVIKGPEIPDDLSVLPLPSSRSDGTGIIASKKIEEVEQVVISCSHEDTVVEGLNLLHRLAFNPSHVALINVEEVLGTFTRFNGSPLIISSACAALHRPAPASTSLIVRWHNMTQIMDALGAHIVYGQSEPAAVILSLLTKLLLCTDETVQFLRPAGVKTVLYTMLYMHTEPTVLLHASAVMALLCSDLKLREEFAKMASEVQENAPAKTALDVLVTSLRLYSYNKVLQSLLCLLLKAACSMCTKCTNAVLKGGEGLLKKILQSGVEAKCVPLQLAAAGWARAMASTADNTEQIASKQGLEFLLDTAHIYGKVKDSGNGLLSEMVLFEAALSVIRLSITNDDIRDRLARLLRESNKGFSDPELMRVSWNGTFLLSNQPPAKGTTGMVWLEQWTKYVPEIEQDLSKSEIVVGYKDFVVGLGFK